MPLNKPRTYRAVGLVLGLIIALHYLGALRMLERSLLNVFVPFSTAFHRWRIHIQDSYRYIRDREHLLERVQALENIDQQLKLQETRVFTLEQENAELKKQLQFQESTRYTMKTTRVVGRTTDGTEKMVIIDAGKKDGIVSGLPVIAGDGILVGVVTEAEKDIALVRLINDNQSKIAATLLNKEGSLGVVEGGYGLSIKMNFIPRNEVVLVGNKVITSGLQKNIPRGLLIGEVAVAENEAYQPFQQAVLTTPIDLSKLLIVSVVMLEPIHES